MIDRFEPGNDDKCAKRKTKEEGERSGDDILRQELDDDRSAGSPDGFSQPDLLEPLCRRDDGDIDIIETGQDQQENAKDDAEHNRGMVVIIAPGNAVPDIIRAFDQGGQGYKG